MSENLKVSREIINFVSDGAPFFDKKTWLSSIVSSKSRLYQYNVNLFFKSKHPEKPLEILKNFIKSFAILLRDSFRCVKAKILFRKRISLLKALNKENIKPLVIKSFAYPSSFKNNYFIDPFFRDLCLHSKIKETKIIYIVDSEADWNSLQQCRDFLIPINALNNPLDLLKSFLNIWFEFFIYPRKVTKPFLKKGKKENSLGRLYRHELSNPQTLINYSFYYSAKRLGSYLPTESRILFTYENNCWERMFCFGLRDQNKQFLISGVQHSVMPEASLNMYLGKNEVPFVDFIDELFVTGKYPRILLTELSEIKKTKIKILGTTRFNYLFSDLKTSAEVEFDFLIALEGLPEASEVIERFLKNCIEGKETPKTLIRLHPAFGIEKMQRYLSYDLNDFPFVKISQTPSVIDDINRSKTLIYWGSTCSLEALMIGKPIIQCHIPANLSYDPLNRVSSNRWVWEENDNIFQIQDKIFSINKNQTERNEEIENGRNFVSSYFSPLDISVFEREHQ